MNTEEKKRRYRLPPSLADGDHYIIVDTKEAVLSAMKAWLDEEFDEYALVRVVEMTDAEVEALPEL